MELALYSTMKSEKIAIPVFEGRISPLFDVAGEFSLFEINNRCIEREYTIETLGFSEVYIISKLKDEETDIIICSAISRCVANICSINHITLISGIIGSVQEVIGAFNNNKLVIEKFVMPGCRFRGGNRNQINKGQCSRSHHFQKKIKGEEE